MNVLLVRVDDRFIHGQILESWIPHLKAQGVVVASDCLAQDQIQKAIMSMAIPERIQLRIVGLEDAVDLKGDCAMDEKRTLVIVSSIKDAFRLHEGGLPFTHLNIGNCKSTAGSRQVSYSVWVDGEDLALVRELIDSGVEVTLQSVPRERCIDMRSILDMVDL
jgi:PTS system mannose-specific IIB component